MDADEAGQRAASRAAERIATVAEVFIVSLPYEIKESHGADLHDYIVADGYGKDFLLLLSKAEKYKPGEVKACDNQEQIPLSNNHALTVGRAFHEDLTGRRIILRHYNYQGSWCEYTSMGYTLREYLDDLRGPGVVGFWVWLFLFSLHWGAEMTSYGLFLREDLGLTLTGMGWYMGIEFVIIAATCLWAGPRCDRGLDPRRLAMAGLVVSGLGQVFMCVPVLWFSVLCRALHGVGDGLIVIVMYLGIERLFDRSRIGGHNSAVNLVMMTGSFAGALASGPAGECFGYEVPLIATGVLVAGLAFFLRGGRETSARPARAPAAGVSGVVPAPATEGQRVSGKTRQDDRQHTHEVEPR